MRIQLLGWESRRLRCPDLNIDFTINGRVPKVGLLQMPNGVGKTTTLACLRAALDGSAADWNETKVRDFRPLDIPSDTGTFIVRLMVNDSERLTFEMNFDFENGIVAYQTTFKKRQESGFVPPGSVAMFLNPRFAKLFIFDGELAKQLLDEQGEDAGRVIDTFYQLYLLDQMKSVARSELEDYTHKWNRRAANPAAVDKLEREIKQLTKQRDELAAKANGLRATLATATARIGVLESEVGEQVRRHEQYRELEHQAEEALLKAKQELELHLQKLASQMPDPCFVHSAFSIGLQRLAASLDRLKLPGPSSKIFFTELAEEVECICGRVLDEKCRAHLRERAQDILADETSNFMNTLKADIRQLGGYEEGRLTDQITTLRKIQKDLGDAEQRKNKIRVELSGDTEILQRQEELEKCKAEAKDAKAFLDDFDRDTLEHDTAESGCRKWFERELADRVKRRAELTGTLDFKNRTDVLLRILDTARATAHGKLKDAAVVATNQRLEKVLVHSPLRIADITTNIRLASASGMAQSGASVGQTLAIGYVFLTTLLNGTAHQFPLVVDSPAGPMDADVRREVAPLVPQLCQQFIALTISTEREGFIDPLYEAAGHDVKFLTAFRRTPGTEPLVAALPATGVAQTANGVLVEGRDYFLRFQLVENK
jgi:DNA sulfur modification protein DndD